jgi:hypothetical protein
VRSYWWSDIATWPDSATSRTAVISGKGWLRVTWNHGLDGVTRWRLQHNSIARDEAFRSRVTVGRAIVPRVDAPSFGFSTTASGLKRFLLPHWFVLCLLLVSAAVPWLRWRFSLRTLLIATTLIAVVLGLVVYVLKWPAG